MLGSNLLTHNVFTSDEGGEETSHIQLLSLEPDVGIVVRINGLFERFVDFLLDVADSRVGQGALGHVTVTEVIDRNVFVLHESVVHTDVVILQSISMELHLLDVGLGFLHHHGSLLEEDDK